MTTNCLEQKKKPSAPNISVATAFQIFKWGVDVGQLFAEEERATEEYADGWKGFAVARKFAMPAMPAERRRVHSEKWFAAKRASLEAFQNYLAGVAK